MRLNILQRKWPALCPLLGSCAGAARDCSFIRARIIDDEYNCKQQNIGDYLASECRCYPSLLTTICEIQGEVLEGKLQLMKIVQVGTVAGGRKVGCRMAVASYMEGSNVRR